MPPSKSNNNVNRKRRRKGDSVQKKLGMLEPKVRAIYRAGQDAAITTTTGTGESVGRTTAAGIGHIKMIEGVIVITNVDVVLTMTMTLTDNGNAEEGIQVRTTTSGVILIEKENEKGPRSEIMDLGAGDRVIQNGNALAVLRAAKNGNVGAAALKILIITIDLTMGHPRMMILRTARVERRQDAGDPQAQNHDASLRLALMRAGRTRPLLKVALLRRTSLQRHHRLFAALPKASVVPPLADRVLPTLQKTKQVQPLHPIIHPKWINTSRPIMTPVRTSHQSWPLMASCRQAALKGGRPCYKSFVYGERRRRRRSVWRKAVRRQRRRQAESLMISSLSSTRSVVLPESGTKERSRHRNVPVSSRRSVILGFLKHTFLVFNLTLSFIRASPVESPFSLRYKPTLHLTTSAIPIYTLLLFSLNSPHHVPSRFSILSTLVPIK